MVWILVICVYVSCRSWILNVLIGFCVLMRLICVMLVVWYWWFSVNVWCCICFGWVGRGG